MSKGEIGEGGLANWGAIENSLHFVARVYRWLLISRTTRYRETSWWPATRSRKKRIDRGRGRAIGSGWGVGDGKGAGMRQREKRTRPIAREGEKEGGGETKKERVIGPEGGGRSKREKESHRATSPVLVRRSSVRFLASKR